MQAFSDNLIMCKVKAGDLDQLGLLFERYHRVLYRFFQNYHQRAECQDLVQTVFMRILKYRLQFDENEGEFKTWMFRIARNVNMDFFKKQKRTRTEIIDNQAFKFSTKMDIHFGEEKEELLKLRRALKNLDPEKREIIVMSKLEGLNYKEIGEVLNCTEGAVKVRVFRALKGLRKQYFELEKNNPR
ncbi:MAG: RNA polymerase sigma factor [Bacteroidota bacterium]